MVVVFSVVDAISVFVVGFSVVVYPNVVVGACAVVVDCVVVGTRLLVVICVFGELIDVVGTPVVEGSSVVAGISLLV